MNLKTLFTKEEAMEYMGMEEEDFDKGGFILKNYIVPIKGTSPLELKTISRYYKKDGIIRNNTGIKERSVISQVKK